MGGVEQVLLAAHAHDLLALREVDDPGRSLELEVELDEAVQERELEVEEALVGRDRHRPDRRAHVGEPEGAQHGAKSLADFLAYAKKSGAAVLLVDPSVPWSQLANVTQTLVNGGTRTGDLFGLADVRASEAMRLYFREIGKVSVV